jgi:hypothetical protein
MTKPEKIKAILARLKKENADIAEAHISAMVITGYLDDLAQAGIIESAFAMTPVGRSVRSICEEFDWKPTDEDLIAFVSNMVGPEERVGFLFMLKKYRDDRTGLLTEFKAMMDKQTPPDEAT